MLTSPPLSPRATEKGLQKLWDELFRSLFTGQPHQTLLGPVVFPLVDLYYNQTAIDAPRPGIPQLHTVFTDLRPRESWWGPNQRQQVPEADAVFKLVECRGALFTFFIRTINAGQTDNSGDQLCRSVADNLKELLQGESRFLLTQKGLRNLHLHSGPRPLATSGFQTRVLMATADLRYFIPRLEDGRFLGDENFIVRPDGAALYLRPDGASVYLVP